MSELRSCVVEAMIRGYHEHQSIWEAEIGENLTCIRDPYAIVSQNPSLQDTSQERCQPYVRSLFESTPVGS